MRLSDNKTYFNLYACFVFTSSFPPFSSASLDDMHKQVNTACTSLKNANNSAGNAVKDREAVTSSLILHSQNLLLSNGKQYFRLSYF